MKQETSILASNAPAPPFFWVKFDNSRAIKVSTEGCHNVNSFIKKVKSAISSLDGVSIERINIYIADPTRTKALRSDVGIDVIVGQTGYPANTSDTPLIVAVGEYPLDLIMTCFNSF